MAERSGTVPFHLRRRRSEDLAECDLLVAASRDTDGYPVYLGPDPRTFLEPPGLLAAWVAERDDGPLVGHIALRSETVGEVIDLATPHFPAGTAFSVVARLMVAPAARRAGTGRALLELASADSRRRSRVPILDVDVRLHAAIALYEAVGLRRLGRVRIRLPTGDVAEELVYAPAP